MSSRVRKPGFARSFWKAPERRRVGLVLEADADSRCAVWQIAKEELLPVTTVPGRRAQAPSSRNPSYQAFGTSFIPHFGHVPPSRPSTSGCIGQV